MSRITAVNGRGVSPDFPCHAKAPFPATRNTMASWNEDLIRLFQLEPWLGENFVAVNHDTTLVRACRYHAIGQWALGQRSHAQLQGFR